MTQKSLFGIGLIAIVIAAIIILVLRHRRTKKWKLELNEVLDLALAIFSGVSGSYVMYQSYSLFDKLSTLVGSEGIVAMFIGGVASIWFGFGKIKELIDKP
jgi:multisubunit Na+/H+ antiporter MnhB subunit